jgi:hypothetical protein
MYHLSPCIVALPNKRVQSDAADAAWYRDPNRLCDVLRVDGHFGKDAARLTRRAISNLLLSSIFVLMPFFFFTSPPRSNTVNQ